MISCPTCLEHSFHSILPMSWLVRANHSHQPVSDHPLRTVYWSYMAKNI